MTNVPFLVQYFKKGHQKLEIRFYSTKNGTEPVRGWLRALDRSDKKAIGENIKTVQFGWPIGMPLVGNIGDGLWEIRTKLNGGRIARVLFFMVHNTMILVHGFFKKTQKTPQRDLELAKKRKREFEQATSMEKVI